MDAPIPGQATIDLALPLIPHDPQAVRLVITEIVAKGPRSYTVTMMNLYDGMKHLTETWDTDSLRAFGETLYNIKRQICITIDSLKQLRQLISMPIRANLIATDRPSDASSSSETAELEHAKPELTVRAINFNRIRKPGFL